jgi:hypothetical protein
MPCGTPKEMNAKTLMTFSYDLMRTKTRLISGGTGLSGRSPDTDCKATHSGDTMRHYVPERVEDFHHPSQGMGCFTILRNLSVM